MDVMRQSACLVLNAITVYNYGFPFNCMTVGQVSESMYGWCLMLVFGWAHPGSTRFSSALSVSHEPLSLSHHRILI